MLSTITSTVRRLRSSAAAVLLLGLLMWTPTSSAHAQSLGPQLLGVAVADALPIGEERTAAASFGHTAGLDALYQAYLVLARADGAPGCTVFYERTTNTVALRSDSGQFINAGPPGATGSANSSWCTLHARGTRVTERNGTLTIEFALTLQPQLEGIAQVFETALDRDGHAAPPTRQATIRVGRGPLAPSTVSIDVEAVTASRPTTLIATYSDPNTWATLTEAYLVAADAVGGDGCYLRYLPATNMLQVRGTGDAWLDAGAPGADGAAGSEFCALNPRASSVSGNGEYVTVRYAIMFAPGFAGKHRLFLLAVDDSNLRTYWDDRGTLRLAPAPIGFIAQLATIARAHLLTWGALFVLVTLLSAAGRMSPRIAWGTAAATLLLAGVLATARVAAAEQVATLALAMLLLGVLLELRKRWIPAWRPAIGRRRA